MNETIYLLKRAGVAIVLMFLLFVALRPDQAEAATYYVATTGSNTNPGTQAAPFATLQRAHDIAVAGDTIFMRGGTYFFSTQTIITRDGTSGNTIKVFAFPGEKPIIDAINQPNNGQQSVTGVIQLNGASFWHFKGLEITNGPIQGVMTHSNSNNNTFEQLNVHNTGRSGGNGQGNGIKLWARLGGGNNNLVLNSDFHDNENVLGPNGGGGGANGIDVGDPTSTGNGVGNIIRGNRVWCNSDDGIDLFGTPATLVENNWVYKSGFGFNCRPTNGDGYGMKLGGSQSGDGGHTIRNNLVWDNKVDGITDNAADIGITFHNNTVYRNNRSCFFSVLTTTRFRNNICFDELGRVATTEPFNSWTVSGITTSAADFGTLDFSSCVFGPRKADGSLPDCNFLKLVAGSDLINKGTNVGIAFNGSAPDLGAFEFGTAVVTDTTPPTVSITAPASGSTVMGTTVTVSATAADNIAVAGVQFQLDGGNLGAEDVSSPYSVTWDSTGVSNGVHSLRAIARDTSNLRTTSTAISVTVSNPAGNSQQVGETTILSVTDTPGGNTIYTRPITLAARSVIDSFTIYANTAAGNVRLGVYDDDGASGNAGTLLAQSAGGTVTAAGWHTQVAITPVALNAGNYWLAFVTNGALVLKAETTGGTNVQDNNPYGPLSNPFVVGATNTFRWSHYATFTPTAVSPPTVTLTAPATGDVSGSTVTVSATASDDVSVSGVSFYAVSGTDAPTAANIIGSEDTSSPYSVVWDTLPVVNGPYTILAVARDNIGLKTTSTGVAVRVLNVLAAPTGLVVTRDPPDL